VYDEGRGGPLDVWEKGFPPPHLEFRQLGFAGLIPPFLRDEILNHILTRFERGDYDALDDRGRFDQWAALNFKRCWRLPNGAVRYYDPTGHSLASHALKHG
jgi:hypothetical protein